MVLSFWIINISGQEKFAGENELFLTPTAKVLDEGSLYISSYEIFYMNAGWSPVQGTMIGVSAPLPMFEGFENGFLIGGKQQVYNEQENNVAIWGVYSPPGNLIAVGGVYTYDTPRFSVNVLLGEGINFNNNETVHMGGLGGVLKISKIFSVMGEVTGFSDEIDGDGISFACIGVRFASKNLLLDFGMLKPFDRNNTVETFPFIKGSIVF